MHWASDASSHTNINIESPNTPTIMSLIPPHSFLSHSPLFSHQGRYPNSDLHAGPGRGGKCRQATKAPWQIMSGVFQVQPRSIAPHQGNFQLRDAD